LMKAEPTLTARFIRLVLYFEYANLFRQRSQNPVWAVH